MASTLTFSSETLADALELSGRLGGFNRVDEAHAVDPTKAALSSLLAHICDGWMKESGVSAADGIRGVALPDLISHNVVEASGVLLGPVHELVFRLPRGITQDDIGYQGRSLRGIAGFGYSQSVPTSNPDEVMFRLSMDNVLKKTYTASECAGVLASKQGSPSLDWTLGFRPDGRVVEDEWDSEKPHLFIGGGTGSGISNVLDLLLTQVMSANDPEDLSVIIVEQGDDLQNYRNIAHVRNLSVGAPDASVHKVAQKTYEVIVTQMERRFAAMASHESKPQNFRECRALYARDPVANADLNFPYIFVVMEECGAYFATPELPDHRQDHKLLLHYTEELARKGRACGIHLVFSTQSPMPVVLPTAVKRQCRRIGLKTTDQMGSRVILDQSGLERLTEPGRGIAHLDGDSIEFKAIHLPAEERDERIAALPKHSDEQTRQNI